MRIVASVTCLPVAGTSANSPVCRAGVGELGRHQIVLLDLLDDPDRAVGERAEEGGEGLVVAAQRGKADVVPGRRGVVNAVHRASDITGHCCVDSSSATLTAISIVRAASGDWVRPAGQCR